ncbi:MAG: transporter [Bacteroidaceae bacterium]|nr:transporter [Bacteroidaceae bacterium]
MKRGIITINNGVVGIPTAPVWMMQEEIADMFNVYGRDIRRAINAVYKDGALTESETLRYIRLDERRSIDAYSIEMIIAIAFRINSKETFAFRRYIINRLYLKNDCNIVLFANGFRKGRSIFN